MFVEHKKGTNDTFTEASMYEFFKHFVSEYLARTLLDASDEEVDEVIEKSVEHWHGTFLIVRSPFDLFFSGLISLPVSFSAIGMQSGCSKALNAHVSAMCYANEKRRRNITERSVQNRNEEVRT